MRVYAYLGVSALINTSSLQWKTVEVAFMGGGVVESVAAEHGLTPQVRGGTAVAVGDLQGSGKTYPSGLAFTVTFASGVDMSGVDIDFSSPITSIISDDPSRYPTVEWSSSGGRVATVVIDTSYRVYAFAPATPISTIELGLSSSSAGLGVTPLESGVTAQIGSDFFGLARLDGQGIPLAQGVPLATASRYVDVLPSHARTAVVPQDVSRPFTRVAYVVGASFVDACGSCSHYMLNPPARGSIRSLTGSLRCVAGDASLTYRQGASVLSQSVGECYSEATPPRLCIATSMGSSYMYEYADNGAYSCLQQPPSPSALPPAAPPLPPPVLALPPTQPQAPQSPTCWGF